MASYFFLTTLEMEGVSNKYMEAVRQQLEGVGYRLGNDAIMLLGCAVEALPPEHRDAAIKAMPEAVRKYLDENKGDEDFLGLRRAPWM